MLRLTARAATLLVAGPLALAPSRASADCATPTEVRLVVTSGDDAASGALDAPWRTIAHAIDNTGPGACVLVGTGAYDEGAAPLVVPADRGGAVGAVWELQSFPAHEALLATPLSIEASFVRIKGIVFVDGAYVATDDLGEAREVDSSRFEGPAPNVAVRLGGPGAIARDNVLLFEGGAPDAVGLVIGPSSGALVATNRVEGSLGAGIRLLLDAGSAATDLVVERNVVIGATRGIDLAPSEGAGLSTARVVRNVVAEAGAEALSLSAEISDVDVEGNTLVGGVVALSADTTGNVRVRNNLFFGQPAAISGEVTLLERNLYGEASLVPSAEVSAVVGDPLFEDLAAIDVRLRGGSPAIDAGLDLGEPFLGEAPDLGALESSASEGSGGASGTAGGEGGANAGGGGANSTGGAGASGAGASPSSTSDDGDGCACGVSAHGRTGAAALSLLLAIAAITRRGVRRAAS